MSSSSSKLKRGNLSVELIVILAIGLLILVIYFGWFSKGASLIHKSTSCGSIGGVLTERCQDSVSIENPAFSDEKKKLKCCVKKLDASQYDYDVWIASIDDISDASSIDDENNEKADNEYNTNNADESSGETRAEGNNHEETNEEKLEEGVSNKKIIRSYTPRIVNRGGVGKIYFSYYIANDDDDEKLGFAYLTVDRDEECPKELNNYRNTIQINDDETFGNKKLCLLVKINNSNYEIKEVDNKNVREFKILDEEGYRKLFNGCDVRSCNYYSKDECSNYKLREVPCQLTLDCFWSNADSEHNTRYCSSCDNKIRTCDDLKIERSCLQNDCLPFKCKWEKGSIFKRGRCTIA